MNWEKYDFKLLKPFNLLIYASGEKQNNKQTKQHKNKYYIVLTSQIFSTNVIFITFI